MAPVRHRHHCGDHLVLVSLKRQVWRHQRTESRKRMEQGLWDQTVGLNNSSTLAVERWMDRSRVLDWIQVPLRLRGFPNVFIFLY